MPEQSIRDALAGVAFTEVDIRHIAPSLEDVFVGVDTAAFGRTIMTFQCPNSSAGFRASVQGVHCHVRDPETLFFMFFPPISDHRLGFALDTM